MLFAGVGLFLLLVFFRDVHKEEKGQGKGEKVTPELLREAAWNLNLDEKTGGPILEEAASRRHLRQARTPEFIAELDKKIEKLLGERDETALRKASRDRDLAYRSWAHHVIDFTPLTEGEQKAAWILLHEVFPHVEAVYALQRDPNNPQYLRQIAAQGDFTDYAHARYSGGPWCQEITDAFCTSLESGRPERVPHQGLWPIFISREEVQILENMPATDLVRQVLLSDFVYRHHTTGVLGAYSLNAHPRYKPHLAKISEGLRKAAGVIGIHPTLKEFLETRAAEFERTDTAFPFFDGDIAWTKIHGGLDVTLGFYESYNSPFHHTAMMEAFIGPVDREKETLGRKFQGLAPEMEKRLTKALGEKYSPRRFERDLPPLKFAHLIGAGDAIVGYVPAAYYLPNVPPYGDKTVYKKVFASNNILSRFETIMKPMGEWIIHPSQRNVSREDFSLFVIGHENAHGVGLRRDETQPLGEFSSAVEEAKADMEGIASLPLAVEQGLLPRDQADRACMATLFSLLRGLSYGMSDAHGVGAIVEFTSLYKEGAIVESEGYFKVEPAKFYAAAEKIARRLEGLQLKAHLEGEVARKEFESWLGTSRADMPPLMKEKLSRLKAMPRDVFPWYTFRFSPKVEEALR